MLVQKVVNLSTFQKVFVRLDNENSGRWTWKMFRRLVGKVDKSAGPDITKSLWDLILLTADVEKNESIWNFLVSKTTEVEERY